MKLCSGWRRLMFCLPLIFFLPHLFSVMELHQESRVEDGHKKVRNKFDHLVLGPAAGQGLHNRLQCEAHDFCAFKSNPCPNWMKVDKHLYSGVKALNKTCFSASSNRSNVGESIAFVTVFTVYNSSDMSKTSGSSDVTFVGNSSYNKVERSIAILNIFVNFIQVAMPQSSVIILTDPASDLSINRDKVSIYPIQGEYSRDKLMLQRIRSYIAFLERKLEDHSRDHMHNYIFVDSDIAVVDDLGQVFRDYPNFHLALTFRNNKQQPLNSGFIAVRGTYDGMSRAKVFLQQVLEVYISKYTSASRMLGDQLALAWVVSSDTSFDAKRFAKAQPFSKEIKGASVLFLPCVMYNWTPPEGAGQFHGMPLDVKVVHFKGSRKRLMLESWNFFSSSSNVADMLCLILSSGRTKYDF